MRRVTTRTILCTMCAKPVMVKSIASPHPEAPELLQAQPPAWIGFVDGEEDDEVELVVVCSELCAQRLLKE